VAENAGLTDDGVEALGLVVPVDAQEVDGHAGQHDGQADAAHHGLRVQGEDEQEGPEQQVDDGPDQADLEGGGWRVEGGGERVEVEVSYIQNKARFRWSIMCRIRTCINHF